VQAIIRQMTQADLRLNHDQVEQIEKIMQKLVSTYERELGAKLR